MQNILFGHNNTIITPAIPKASNIKQVKTIFLIFNTCNNLFVSKEPEALNTLFIK